MDVIAVLQLLGGVGLFLYGMSLMTSSLEKLAGSGLEKILGKLTTSKKKGVGPMKGWGFGVGVTAVIQSSAAVTIMMSGFVNAGIKIIKTHHVDRLQAGDCSIEGGVSLFDLINSFERIASHAANVSLHVIKKVGGDKNFDEMHGHANDIFSECKETEYRG